LKNLNRSGEWPSGRPRFYYRIQPAGKNIALPDAPLAVAGGIDAATAVRVSPYAPAVVIVGSGIANAPDPRAAAMRIREALA